MKQFIRITALVLALALCLPFAAYAAEERGSDYFIKNNAYLYKTGSTTFQIWFDSVALGIMDTLGSSYIVLERSSNGTSGWTTVASFYPSSYPQMLSHNQGTYANYISFVGASGYYYRATVEFYAENSNGSSYKYITTSAIKIP